MSTSLTDIDELAIKIRDGESRLLFAEAMSAYRSGAFRSAVTSIWIAIVHDVFAKVRELAAGGDNAAAKYIQELEGAIQSKSIPALQKIESMVLDSATDTFQLLSAQERVDLERLQDDRNLCAHPALNPDGTLFRPSAELVRAHLVHAAAHLLQHPPVQGKSALDRLVGEITSPSFPPDRERAFALISERLKRAKESLVRNLLHVLLKGLIVKTDTNVASHPEAAINAIAAIRRTHGVLYEREVSVALATWGDALQDGQLVSVLRLTASDSQCWTWLTPASRIRVTALVNGLSASEFATAGGFDGLAVQDLRPALLARFMSLREDEKRSVIAENPRPEFAEEAIRLFERAASWRGAESLAQGVILTMVPHFTSAQLVQVLQAARENSQIWDAGGMPDIFVRLFDSTTHHLASTGEEWATFAAFVLRKNQSGVLSYPELQARLASHHIKLPSP